MVAEPTAYARYFDVSAKGRRVTLSTVVNGKPRVAFVLVFDADARLVKIADDHDRPLVEIAWGSNGPMSARMRGEAIAGSFTGQSIDSASTWAHRDARPGVLVELPGHLVDFWQKRVAEQIPGTPGWRHANRQLLVAAAATQNRALELQTFDALRTHGGVEL